MLEGGGRQEEEKEEGADVRGWRRRHDNASWTHLLGVRRAGDPALHLLRGVVAVHAQEAHE